MGSSSELEHSTFGDEYFKGANPTMRLDMAAMRVKAIVDSLTHTSPANFDKEAEVARYAAGRLVDFIDELAAAVGSNQMEFDGNPYIGWKPTRASNVVPREQE